MPRLRDGNDQILHVQQRVQDLVKILLETPAMGRLKMQEEVIEGIKIKYEVSERTAYRYLRAARGAITKYTREETERAFKKAIRERELLLLYAKEEGENGKKDIKMMLEIMKDRDRLKGLYVDRILHGGRLELEHVDVSKLSDEELERIVRGEGI